MQARRAAKAPANVDSVLFDVLNDSVVVNVRWFAALRGIMNAP